MVCQLERSGWGIKLALKRLGLPSEVQKYRATKLALSRMRQLRK